MYCILKREIFLRGNTDIMHTCTYIVKNFHFYAKLNSLVKMVILIYVYIIDYNYPWCEKNSNLCI